MAASGQARQDLPGIGLVARLLEDLAGQNDDGVGPEDQAPRQTVAHGQGLDPGEFLGVAGGIAAHFGQASVVRGLDLGGPAAPRGVANGWPGPGTARRARARRGSRETSVRS